jgi:hypothetical protein
MLAVAIGLSIGLLLLSMRRFDRLANSPLSEDGFYQLAIARHLALGHGITIDGHTWTNGFQPLFTFLCAVLFKITGGARFETLRLVLLLDSLFEILTAVLLALIARDAFRDGDPLQRALRFWFTLLLYLGSVLLLVEHHNGMETGMLLLMYSTAWRYYQMRGLPNYGGCIVFATMCGLLVLTRIDAALLVAIVAFAQLLQAAPYRQRLVRFALLGATSFLVSSPWWLYNLLCFGSLMPVSGQAETSVGLTGARVVACGNALLWAGVPYLYGVRFHSIIATLIALVCLAGVLAGIVRYWKRWSTAPREDAVAECRARRTIQFGRYLALTGMVLLVYYAFTSFATYFYLRYACFLALISVPLTACVAAQLAKSAGRRAVSAILVVCLQLPVALLFAHTGLYVRGNESFEQQLRLVRQHVSDSETVAAYQTGTLGYFRDHVLNLDGKVNPEALRQRKRIPQYLAEKQVNWCCEGYQVLPPDMQREMSKWTVVDAADFTLYRRHAP